MTKNKLIVRQEVDFAPGENTYGLQVYREVWRKVKTGKDEIHWKYGLPDGVQVAAFTPDKKIIAIEESFLGVEAVPPRLVGETLEKDELPLLAAQRGLFEETGYVSGNWQVMSVIRENSRKSDRCIYIFFALDCVKTGIGEKEINTRLLDPKDFWNILMKYFLIQAPEMPHVAGNTLKAFTLALTKLDLLRV